MWGSSKITWAVMILIGTACASAAGQARSGAAPARFTGNYAGRHIGFQPQHGQVHVPPTQQGRRLPHGRTALPTRSVASEVAATDFAEPTLADEGSMPVTEGDFFAAGVGEPVIVDDCQDCVSPVMEYADPAVWGRAEYLLWWTQGTAVPALVTTSTAGTAQENAGVLGQRSTSTLFGDGDLLDGSRSGGRFAVGLWLDPCHTRGLEFSYLSLSSEEESFSGTDDDFSILARPFRDAVTGAQDARLVVFPNLIDGNLRATLSSEFQTGEVLWRRPLASCAWSSLDCYVGYRYANLEDQIDVVESTTSLAAPTLGTTFDLEDHFLTSNEFHGGQLGLRAVRQSSPLYSLELLGKFALGNTTSRTTIDGETTVAVPNGGTTVQSAGLLTQGTNIGTFEDDELSTIIEVGATLRRHLTCNFSLTAGYSYFLWTDVVRAGDQIDTDINVSQVPPGTLSGTPRPAYPGQTTDFWAHGLRLGVEYNY